MKMKPNILFPEIPTSVDQPTQAERDEIASRIIAIYENPPEVTLHWEKNGKRVKDGSTGATEMKTSKAHESLPWRIRRAINDSSLSAARKQELGKIKYALHSVDEEIFKERDSVITQIEALMNSADAPSSKAELDAAITTRYIPVKKFTRRYMDNAVSKVGATFAEFKSSLSPAAPV